MSVELATLTGLKNDLRTFGAATKEITGTAGEALSKGDSFYIGTDGNFYKTASAEEAVGSFSLDQETGMVLEHENYWQVKQAVNSNGWIAGVCWRSWASDNYGANANNIIFFVINPSDGSITTQKIYSSIYRYVSNSTYNPYARTIGDVNITFKDDTHIWILHDEREVRRDSNNQYNNGFIKIWSKVYTLNETTGATSGIKNESNTLVSGQTSSGSISGTYGYSLFWPGADGVFWYKGYAFSQHWNHKVTLNSTYNSSVSTSNYSNSAIASRSSDHYVAGYYYNEPNDRTYLFSTSNPSTASYYYGTSESSLNVTGAPSGTGNFTLVDNLFVGTAGNYEHNTTPITGDHMLVYELDFTSSTSLTWTEFPLEIGNFPFPKGTGIAGNAYHQSRNFPWAKIGSDYYFVLVVGQPRDYYYEEINGSQTSYSMYDSVVCKLTKDVANSKYVLDFVCVLDDTSGNYGHYPHSIFKDSSNNLKVLAQKFDTVGGTAGNTKMWELVTYDVTPYIAGGQAGASVNGVIKADVASGATATGIIEGQLADIAVPVGTSINGWTGIGNNQAVKG